MSTLLQTALAAAGDAPPGPAVLAASCGQGIFDCATTKVNQAGSLFRALSAVAGVGFVIYQAISSRGAMARILISGLAAGVFVWIVWNVTTLRDRVDNEVSAPPAVVQPHSFTAAATPSHRDLLALEQRPLRAGEASNRWAAASRGAW